MKKSETLKKIIYGILLVGAILAAIKCIFVGLQRDEDYAITLAYRLINGDRLLSNVWDPHQTSAFLLSLMELIYIKLTGGVKFLVIAMRCVATGIHAGITIYFYHTLKKILKKEYAYLLAIVYFAILPKGFITPEFSIMMSWFSSLLILILINMRIGEKSKVAYVFSSIALGAVMCMLVLSYPSCAIIFIFVCIYLFLSKAFPKYCGLVFVGTCLLIGGVYILGLLSYMTPSELIFNAKSVITSCGSHGDSKLAVYLSNFLISTAIVLVQLLCGGIVAIVVCLIRKKAITPGHIAKMSIVYGTILAGIYQVLHWVFTLSKYNKGYERSYYFALIYAALIILAIKGIEEKLNKEILLIAMIVNVLGFVAVLILTNLTLFASIQYLVSGIVISLATIVLYMDKQKVSGKLLLCMLIVVAFATTVVKGLSYSTDDGSMMNITKVAKLVRECEPAKGIITEYMRGYTLETTKEEWDQYIKDGDCVLVWDEQTLAYLNKDVRIGSYTTISTPTYDEESVMNYWKQNPDAYPNVIAVSCWYGELKVDEKEWFYQWIANEYGASQVIDGKYYRYFIAPQE